jgi:hypothetical protein
MAAGHGDRPGAIGTDPEAAGGPLPADPADAAEGGLAAGPAALAGGARDGVAPCAARLAGEEVSRASALLLGAWYGTTADYYTLVDRIDTEVPQALRAAVKREALLVYAMRLSAARKARLEQ